MTTPSGCIAVPLRVASGVIAQNTATSHCLRGIAESLTETLVQQV